MVKKEEPTRKRYDSDDTKKRLVRAATNIFSKLGYDASTTRQIAEHAGVNESLIHRYFTNKEGLFFAILRDVSQEKNAALPYPAAENLHDELLNFFRFRIENHRKKKKFLRLLILRAITDPKVRTEMREISRNGLTGLIERLESHREKQRLVSTINLEHLSSLLSGIAFSMAMFSEVISTMDPEKANAVLELGAKLLADALTPKP